jgi:hypothetical protein
MLDLGEIDEDVTAVQPAEPTPAIAAGFESRY